MKKWLNVKTLFLLITVAILVEVGVFVWLLISAVPRE